MVARKSESSWGSVTVTGVLGQGHRDILDAILVAAEGSHMREGRLEVLVDQYQLRSLVSSGRTELPYTHIWKLLRDLRAAEVVMEMPAMRMRVTDGILAEVVESGTTSGTHPGGFKTKEGGPRPMLKVTFGRNWTRMLGEDIHVDYDLRAVVALRHGAAQAIARFCLSQREVHDTLDGLLEKVGYDATDNTPRAVNKLKAEIRGKTGSFAKIEIAITQDGKVHRSANKRGQK